MSEVSMVFFRLAQGVDLAAAGAALREAGLDVEEAGACWRVRWDDGPLLRVGLSAAPQVAAQASALGEGGAVPGIGACDVRFEIAIDDLDEALDEANTLIEVQATLQGLTGGYLFNSWNAELLPPDEDGG